MTARPKLKEPITARPRMAISPRKPKPGEIGEGIVSHPTLEGMQEKVSRIINTIEYMAARKQLDKRQIRVAEMLLNAHQVLYGSIGLNQDTTKVSGGVPSGKASQDIYMNASQRLREAKKYLYPPLYRVVISVAVYGFTIEQTALAIHGETTKHYKELTGKKLRDGLHSLADRWVEDHGGSQEGRIVGFRTADARPTESTVGTIKPGKTAHAARGRVFR